MSASKDAINYYDLSYSIHSC